jgi:hypothetical protein
MIVRGGSTIGLRPLYHIANSLVNFVGEDVNVHIIGPIQVLTDNTIKLVHEK